MTTWHSDLHKRKRTGGKKGVHRKKRRYERGGDPILPLIGEREVKIKRARGCNIKVAVKADNKANVFDPLSKKTTRVDILAVKANPANRDFERRGILSKGAIIETPLGEARITSKPSADGVINAVLIKSK